MLIKPRPGFEVPLAVADAVNPYLILLSIVGLFLEYTPVKAWVIPVNQVIDVLFVLDFAIRLICQPTGRYFVHGYGWVDFLASLPGLTLVLSYTPLFGAFKFLRIGRFFKVIRVLRFLRVFSFLKKMKSDSVYVQDKIMKIGVTVVLVFVAGLFLVDTLSLKILSDAKTQAYQVRLADLGGDVARLADSDPMVLYFSKDGQIFDRKGQPVADAKGYELAQNDQNTVNLEVPLKPGFTVSASGVQVPTEGLLVAAPDVETAHDELMLTLVTTLVVLLVFLIFYIGSLFARDMHVVHLIVDSIDADDYLLLNDQVRQVSETEGGLEVNEGENEIQSLLKTVGRLTLEKEGAWAESEPEKDGEILARLDAIEARLSRTNALTDDEIDALVRASSLQAVKSAVPSVVNYLKEKFPSLK